MFCVQAVGIILGIIAAKLAGETFDIEILTPIQSLIVVVGISLSFIICMFIFCTCAFWLGLRVLYEIYRKIIFHSIILI
jgi:hypothetical protein